MIDKQFDSNLGVMTKEEFEKLTQLKILVVGLGGLGGNVVNLLVRLGIKQIGLCDYDKFDESNLNRQLFSSHNEIGKYKIKVISDELLNISPSCNIELYNKRIQDLDDNEVSEYDFIIDAVDDVETKKYIVSKGSSLNKYVLHGACGGWYGQVGWISPGNQLLTNIYDTGNKGLEEELLNPSFTPSVTASYMVSEFLKLVLQKDGVVIDELLLIDLMNNTLLRTGK